MEKINIIHTRSDLYREQIIQLWHECLPGTSAKRFDWLTHGNPAGPVEWFLAINQEDGTVIGTSSILPKDLYYNGQKLRGGIVGDIMVSPAHRRKGIAKKVQDEIKSKLTLLKMEFLYVVPNNKSQRMFSLNNSYHTRKLRNYLIPIDTKHYFRLFKLGFLCNNIGKIFNRYLDHLYSPIEKVEFDITLADKGVSDDIDLLWSTLRNKSKLLCGEKTTDYLKWKYSRNPHKNFHILKHKTPSGNLLGYCIFTVSTSKVHLYELVADCKNSRRIISTLKSWCNAENHVGIYFSAPSQNPMLKNLPWTGRFRIGGDIQFFCSGEIFQSKKNWLFFAGERNI